MTKMINMKDLLKEVQKEDLDHLYSNDKKQIEKEFVDVDHFLKAMAIDLGKAGYKKQSIEFQRFYKKYWIEFKLKFEKLYKNVIGGK